MQIKRASARDTDQLLLNNKSALLRPPFSSNQRRGRVRRFKPVSGRRLCARFGGMDKKWNRPSGKTTRAESTVQSDRTEGCVCVCSRRARLTQSYINRFPTFTHFEIALEVFFFGFYNWITSTVEGRFFVLSYIFKIALGDVTARIWSFSLKTDTCVTVACVGECQLCVFKKNCNLSKRIVGCFKDISLWNELDLDTVVMANMKSRRWDDGSYSVPCKLNQN